MRAGGGGGGVGKLTRERASGFELFLSGACASAFPFYLDQVLCGAEK